MVIVYLKIISTFKQHLYMEKFLISYIDHLKLK